VAVVAVFGVVAADEVLQVGTFIFCQPKPLEMPFFIRGSGVLIEHFQKDGVSSSR
jgi:hypothetical protein